MLLTKLNQQLTTNISKYDNLKAEYISKYNELQEVIKSAKN